MGKPVSAEAREFFTAFLLGGWEPWCPWYPPAESFLSPAAAALLRRLQWAERDGDLMGMAAGGGLYGDRAAADLARRGFVAARPRVLVGERRPRWVLTESGRRT